MQALLLRWKISRIARSAARQIRARGVKCSVWWFGAYYLDPKHLVFVVCVDLDEQRDKLRSDKSVASSLNELLAKFNWPSAARPNVVFDIESHETVQRENGGNWWYHYK